MAKEIIQKICDQVNLDFVGMSVSTPSTDFIFVQKYNWNYLDALAFQEACVDYVYQHPAVSIIIATNHPACLTLGKGLQRKIGDTTELVDFTKIHRERVAIPIYDIKRGGGVTFHHPGQLVIYPIVNLTRQKLKVYTLMSHLLRELSCSLRELFGDQEFDYCRDLLGLWVDQHKVASIGLQVRRFVTFHGVALNVLANKEIEEALKVIYPCGLPGATYQNLGALYQKNFGVKEVKSIAQQFEHKVVNLFAEENCVFK